MSGEQVSHGLRLDPIAEGSAEALVVLLQDAGGSAAALMPVATRWAPAVPAAAFVALDVPTPDVTTLDAATLDPTTLDRAARRLAPQLEQQLHVYRLEASQLVLVGFGQGGTIALHLLLHGAWRCAGALAFSARLLRPLPRPIGLDGKVRLIESARNGDMSHVNLRDTVMSLVSRGVDARGVVLAGDMLADEAIRHGGAYLVELVATAQRGDHFHLQQENHDAQ